MEDARIVQLYWDRDEAAIDESSKKYGACCASVARNILSDPSDAEECVSDTWLHAWNAMPPHRPAILSAFLCRITRNLSFDRYRRLHREKRGGRNVDAALEALGECVSGRDDTERLLEGRELIRELDRFLMALPEAKRHMFILRYWYAAGVGEIAERMGISENNVSVSLSRIRRRLKAHLIERGFDV